VEEHVKLWCNIDLTKIENNSFPLKLLKVKRIHDIVLLNISHLSYMQCEII